jgi:antirestriction protein ArdC
VLKDYQSKPLIKNAGPEFIDFWRFKHIPREHAKWIGSYLSQLSDDQIRDAFRAAEFSPAEVEGFTQKVREKINELVNL